MYMSLLTAMQKGGRGYAKKNEFNGSRYGIVAPAGVSGAGSGNA
jgi:hypothetical protein